MRFVGLFFLILIVNIGLSQNLKFKTYRVEDGLSNNSVNSIEVDKYGVLWIATWDGINYYDGHHFVTFKHIESDSTSIPHNFVHEIIKDIHDNIWILSTSNQVSLSNNDGTFTNFKFEEKVDRIGLTKNKTILAKAGSHLYTFSNNQFIHCKNCNFYDKKEPWKDIFKQYFPEVKLVDYLKDSKGNLWIGTRNNGLFYIPANKILDLKKSDIQNYKNDPYQKFSLQSNEILDIKEDIFNNIWIGTKDGGLSRVYKNSESIFYVTNHPDNNPYLPNEAIRAITVDNQNQIWLGYYSHGVFIKKISSPFFTHFTIPKASENPQWNEVRSLYTTSDGSVFVGTYAGILRYKNGKINYFQAENIAFFPNNRVYAFYETQDQLLYISCWGGVALFDLNKNEFVAFNGQSMLNDYHVRDLIKIDSQLFIATEKNGVVLLENGKVSKITEEKNFPENSVYSLWYDEANENLWIGTLGGILIYSNQEKKIIKKIKEEDGLKSHLIYGILGHDNQVWISTTDGLLMIDKNTYDVYVYPGIEGLQASEFSEGAYHMDSKHIIYFGGVKGLNYFNPDNLDLKENFPILKLYVDEIENTGEITKSFNENNVIYTIDPTFYGESNGNKIYYKLEGYDKYWKSTNYDKKEFVYSDLPPGNYTFKVKNSHDSKNFVKSELHILNPFWKTIYFYLIIMILSIILIVIILFIKRKNHLKRERILENKIEERVKEISIQKKNISQQNDELIQKNLMINEQKEILHQLHAKLKTESMEMDKFNAYLVKEYRNPLSKICLELKSRNSKNDTNILSEINNLLNKLLAIDYLGKMEKNYQINPVAIELETATNHIMNDITHRLEENNIKFNLKKNTQKIWVLIDVLYYKLLLKYVCTDICKYIKGDNILDITYDISYKYVSFSIITNHPMLLKNLYYIKHYSPYYKACKTIARLMNIDFDIQTKDNQTIFNISFVPNLISEDTHEHSKLNWMHLELEKQIDKNKPTILVWANEEDFIIIKQFISKEKYNILVEKDKELLLSVIKNLKINLLIVYNINLNEDLYKITTKLNKKFTEVRILYISDDISYELEYQSIEMGIDDVIQLPANNFYIDNKIKKILSYHKNDKKSQNIYDSLNKIFHEKIDGTNENIIRDAVEVIQNRMSDSKFNVKELCEALDLSTIKLYRIFKELLNIPPSEFILNIKMNKAESLLSNSSLNIAEIAYETGFADPKYFSKVFKKMYGKSPKKYRRELRES